MALAHKGEKLEDSYVQAVLDVLKPINFTELVPGDILVSGSGGHAFIIADYNQDTGKALTLSFNRKMPTQYIEGFGYDNVNLTELMSNGYEIYAFEPQLDPINL